MRNSGLHIRINSTLQDVLSHAQGLELPFFQCFLTTRTGQLLSFEADDIQKFLEARRNYFKNLYVHGSYWINLANIRYTNHYALFRELELARKLEFTHMIIHPGSTKGSENRLDGIDAMARVLNKLFVSPILGDMQIVLENTAHGSFSIGGDLHDFNVLLHKLDKPEKLQFCIDTAHAYVYGYNIKDEQEQNIFIDLIESLLGINSIALLHLNDTQELCGSKIDQHEIPGMGNLGIQSLKRFALHQKLRDIPILMELPEVSQEREKEILAMVQNWF